MNRLIVLALAAVLTGLTFAPPSATAQPQTRTLTIHNNTVHVNGTELNQDQLPESLDVSGVEAQYRFIGIRKPVVDINGKLYAITDRLEPVSEDEIRQQNDASVVLQRPQAASDPGFATASSRSAPAPREQSSAESGSQEASSDMQEAHQQYLSEIQQSHQELYRNLVRERRMESESREIARTIRLLPDGPERDAQIDTLRATLNRIFELKQDNRRREIEQLQRQIDELERRLEQREAMREEMIERRMNELLGIED